MSHIEELIAEKCPDGVEFRKIGEICSLVRGASPRPISAFITTESNGVNWIKIGDVKAGSKYITTCAEKITPEGAKKSRFVKKGSFILSNSMSFGRPYILDIDGCIHDGWLSLSDFEQYLIPDYFYYVLISTPIQREMEKKASFGGAVQNLNSDIVKSIEIPVPPIEVQQEIVRILDTFTELEAKLVEELDARKKQYEYMLDETFAFDDSVEKRNILDVISMKARVGWQALTKKEYLSEGDYYLITGTDFLPEGKIGFDSCVYVTEDRFNMDDNIKVHENDILMTKDGTLGKVAFMTSEPPKPATLNGGVYRLTILAEDVLPRYVYHYFTSNDFHKFIDKVQTGGTIKHLTQKLFETMSLPIPSIEEQKRIIETLDMFNCLCNDDEKGLPAEIATRHKQYEYYRDKLLTFERKAV